MKKNEELTFVDKKMQKERILISDNPFDYILSSTILFYYFTSSYYQLINQFILAF